jgi:hypothetical protein
MKSHLITLLAVISLLLCVTLVTLAVIDHGRTGSRDLVVYAGRTAYGLSVDGENVYCGTFRGHDGESAWSVYIKSSPRIGMNFYFIAKLIEARGIWPHLGSFGAGRVTNCRARTCSAAPRS